MRTTLAIDDDLVAAARSEAAYKRQTIGAIVSARLRQSYQPLPDRPSGRHGLPVLPTPISGGRLVTTDEVSRLLDESE